MIKSIRLFVNNNDESIALGKVVKDSFIKEGFTISEDNYDLGIAIGGDGSFLRMIKSTSFDSNPYYVGINSGTLGFLQEVGKDEIDKLLYELKNHKYKEEEIGIQETNINYDNGKIKKLYSLNEILIMAEQYKMAKLDIYIENNLLEHFVGDGMIIATSYGSTAHNLSYGGSIVYNSFSSLQLTPIGPINSSVYTSLPNSVIIPSNMNIIIYPTNSGSTLSLAVDGDINTFNDVN